MTLRNARHWIWPLVSVWSMACAKDSQAFPGGKQGPAFETAVWTKVVAPSMATARAANVFVYDEARENCVVFGGRPVDDHGSSLEDTGIWSGETWVPVAAEYGRRGNVTGAFDTRRERTVVYGGTDGFSFFDDTWEFDGSWWTRHRVRSPGDRSGNGLAYDSRRNVTVLFGGYSGRSWKDELWEWDGNTWTQGCTAEPCSVAPRPAARANAVFVYDDAREVSLLFGGSRDGESYDDTWTWDGERWHRRHPDHAPLARASAAATYDPVSKRVLLFGGLAAGLQELNDFWAWDGHDWTPISQATVPFARHGAGMAWHAKDRHGILFGGSASGNETDAWEFKLFGTPCTASADCHVGTCVQGSCPAAPDLPENIGGGGASAGETSGGWAGDPSTANGGSGSGCGCGGRQTNPGGSASGDAGLPPAASGGTAADAGGAGGAPRTPSSTRDDTAPARSFYSCALSPTSRATRASVASIAVLGGFATWLLRRRSWARRNPRRHRE